MISAQSTPTPAEPAATPDLQPLLTIGIDAGAAAVKVAIMRSVDGQTGDVLATAVQRIRRRHIHDVVDAAFDEACAQAGVGAGDFAYVASTGDGEAVRQRTGHFYGMTTHARGAVFLAPNVRSVLDIGALHARAIRIDARGKVLGQRMTSQCASGSGQFVENIARYLGVPLEDVGQLATQAGSPEKVSSICAVLAETDVINMVSRGVSTADILSGIHHSIAGRLVRLLRAVGAEEAVLLSGGMGKNAGMVMALMEGLGGARARRSTTDIEVVTHPDAQLTGAFGAALLGAFRYRQLERLGRKELLVAA